MWRVQTFDIDAQGPPDDFSYFFLTILPISCDIMDNLESNTTFLLLFLPIVHPPATTRIQMLTEEFYIENLFIFPSGKMLLK